MKLTIDNWSYSNVKDEIKDFSHIEKVELAVFCAEKVIGIFESKYPCDNRPRLSIEAAKEFIKNPTDENKQKCGASADAVDAAYTASADAYDYAASAASAASYAAAYTASADAYDYVASAASAADTAAYAAYRVNLKQEVINHIKKLKGGEVEEIAKDKSVYTQEMADNGGLPQVGSKVLLVSLGMTTYNKEVTITYIGNGVGCYKVNDGKEFTFAVKDVYLKPIDTRTDKEKLIDDISKIIESKPSLKECAVDIINKYDIKLK